MRTKPMKTDLLRRLSEAVGVPGFEGLVADIFVEELKALGYGVEIRRDSMGNVIAHFPGTGPKVAVAAHMDEIGFIVRFVDPKDGFLRLATVGGFDPKTLIAQRVMILGANDDWLPGVIGTKPIHVLKEEDRKKPVELDDLFVDLLGHTGMPGKMDKVRELVELGAPVALVQLPMSEGGVFCGKAMDDRVGMFVILEALPKALENGLGCDLYIVGTTQEEVGLRGATVAAFGIAPDISVALDVTIAGPMPGLKPEEQITEIGKGVGIAVLDKATISHPGLVMFFRKLALKEGIPYQIEVATAGGTDVHAFQMAGSGSAAVTLSLPCQYVHSVVEKVAETDVDAAIRLLALFLQRAGEFKL